MPQTTVGEAIKQVARYASLTNGKNMTPYSNDAIISYLVGANELIAAEHEWAETIVWVPRVLDGAIGRVTELITTTKDWKRIRRLYHEAWQTPLPLLSSYQNPMTSTLLVGFRPLAPQDDNAVGDGRYLLQFYPQNLTGRVLFQIENVVNWTDEDAIIPIDWWLHVYYAAHQYCADDGTNPVQIDNLAKLKTQRMHQITARENNRHSWEQPNQLIPNDWWEQDAPYS